jgi:hypothetical protein
MLSEAKILFENIRHFRQLLSEAVGDSVIVDAINEHKYLYIYYEGETTQETGYRTIRPFVLGRLKNGNLALRAWQDKGRSDSLRPDSPRNRLHHEHEFDEGKTKPGWRLFLVDNIKSAYPTGVKFNKKDGSVMMPTGYKEKDKSMVGGIVASIAANGREEMQTSGITGTTTQKVPRYEKFKNADINKRKLTKADVIGLYDIATRVMKKSINRFFVSIDDQNYYYLQDKNIKTRFPQNAIVGDLDVLYDQFVRKQPQQAQQLSQTDTYMKQELDKLAKSTAANNAKTPEEQKMMKENEKFPVDKRTFFKI